MSAGPNSLIRLSLTAAITILIGKFFTNSERVDSFLSNINIFSYSVYVESKARIGRGSGFKFIWESGRGAF